MKDPILNFRVKAKRIDVVLNPGNIPDKYKSIGIEIGLYPIDKKLNSDSFKVLPYEEYTDDIADNIRSTYYLEEDNSSKIFGVFLSLLFLLIVSIFNRGDIYSIESIVAVIGAYTLGRELWTDLAKIFGSVLQGINQNLRFKISPQYFSKISYSVISDFFDHARKERYGETFSLSNKFRFSTQSNSKIIDLVYENKKMIRSKKDVLICIFEFNKKMLERVHPNDFLIAVKLTLPKRRLFHTQLLEVYQVIDKGEVGVFSNEVFYPNAILRQTPITSGKVKLYKTKRLVHESTVVSI